MAQRSSNDFEVWYGAGLGPQTADNPSTTTGAFERWYTDGLGPTEAVLLTLAPSAPGGPMADLSDGGWTNELGSAANLYASVDEAVFSDTDYIQSSLSPATPDEVKLTIGSLTAPTSGSFPAVGYRYKKDQTGGHQIDLTVRLYAANGTTLIAEQTHTSIDAITDGTLMLTALQTAAIPTADYATGLVLGFRALVGGAPSVDYVTRWGVVEYWALDEASGSALATISSANNMIDNNTVTSAGGKISTLSRHFDSASFEHFSLADNATVSTGDIDFWAAAWVWFDTVPSWGSYPGIVSKWENSPNWEWELYFDGDETGTAHKFAGVISGDGSSLTQVYASTFGTPSTGTWYFAMLYHDAVSNLFGISINGGPFDTVSHTTGCANRGSQFGIGFNGGGHTLNGRINGVAYGKSPALGIAALRDEIRDRLYNGGAGRPYPWTT